MSSILIKAATVVNEGKVYPSDIYIRQGVIEEINPEINRSAEKEINAEGLYLFPGCIDDQVHFREPGLTHKADIFTESRAAVAGGVTSFMEMPNTVPNTVTQELLEEKYAIASMRSLANYSFFMGATNDNLEEVLKTDPERVCGIKIFMGSSTGNMLVDNEKTLESIFSASPMLIATHCEDEEIIRKNMDIYRAKYGDEILPEMHPLIRSAGACYKSSSFAVELAKRHQSRLHVLHISTARETELFENTTPLRDKKITAEACIHHLWFSDEDYASKGNMIKWNPAVKSKSDREGIFRALMDGRIDVVATDHAPHTVEEKSKPYLQAPSGGPLVQYSLLAMLQLFHGGKLSLEQIAEKMAHNPSVCFKMKKRGFIREGYFADLVLADLRKKTLVCKENILSKCGWSPFEGFTFDSKITHTIVSGHLAYSNGVFNENKMGERLCFMSQPVQ